MANRRLNVSPPLHNTPPPAFWPTIRPHLVLVAILVLSVGMRLPYLGIVAHGDLLYFNAPWTREIQRYGLFQVYAFDSTLNYPPLYLLMLGLIAAVLPISNESFFVQLDTQLLILLKFIPILSEVLLIIAAYYWLPRGSRLRWVIPVMLSVYPGLLITTPFWGQTDAVLTLFLALTLIALNRDKPRWSWGLFALALLMKFQAIVLLPLLACLSFRRYGGRRTVAGVLIGLVVIVAVLLPFVIGSGYDQTMKPFTGAVDLYQYTSLNAFNLWYVADPVQWDFTPGLPKLWRLTDDTEELFGIIDYKDVGLAMFGLYALLILVAAWRRYGERREFVWAGALYFGFFMLPTQIHERYLYPAAALSLLAAAQDRRLWPVALGTMLTYTYNVVVVVDSRFYWFGLDFVALVGNIAIVVGLMNLILLAWAGWVAVSRPLTTSVNTATDEQPPHRWWWDEWSPAFQRRVGRVIWGSGAVCVGLLALVILAQLLTPIPPA